LPGAVNPDPANAGEPEGRVDGEDDRLSWSARERGEADEDRTIANAKFYQIITKALTPHLQETKQFAKSH